MGRREAGGRAQGPPGGGRQGGRPRRGRVLHPALSAGLGQRQVGNTGLSTVSHCILYRSTAHSISTSPLSPDPLEHSRVEVEHFTQYSGPPLCPPRCGPPTPRLRARVFLPRQASPPGTWSALNYCLLFITVPCYGGVHTERGPGESQPGRGLVRLQGPLQHRARHRRSPGSAQVR